MEPSSFSRTTPRAVIIAGIRISTIMMHPGTMAKTLLKSWL